jgi:hypothetical protein
MDFQTRHAITEKNEKMREVSGRYTLRSLLGNVNIGELKPNPIPCKCGSYPQIDIDDSKGACFVSCNGCSVNLEFSGSYAGAILKWNSLLTVDFDLLENKINPFINFNAELDGLDDFIFKVHESTAILLALKTITSRSEKKLINLMCHWNHFSISRVESLKVLLEVEHR